MRKYLFFLLALITSFSAFSQDFSNKGKEFWVCYPEHINGTGSVMGLYLTSNINTSGTINDNGTIINFNVTANNITTVFLGSGGAGPNTYIHLGGLQDGIKTNAAVKITSLQPIVVYAHIINSARSGATLSLPTKVWGKEYIVPSYVNTGGNGTLMGYGELNIMASLPNTVVEITPSITSRSGKPAGIPFTITLANPGDVYQLQFPQNTDMSGTKVKSIASGTSSCQPIAVISATTWSAINCNTGTGGDNFYQQLFPLGAWGKTFYTTPLKKVATSASDNNIDLIRVYVKDPSTVVKKTDNGVTIVLTGLTTPGNYYEYSAFRPTVVKADQPVEVMQYITSQNCGNPVTQSDPEMIALSSEEQTLNDITVYSAIASAVPFGNSAISIHYVNVTMKTAGTGSFKINGATPSSAFIPITGTSYSYLKQNIPTNAPVSRLTADSGFSAIAYGFGNVESYGYNAGTNVIDLNQQLEVGSQYGIETSPNVCTNSPFVFKVYFPDSSLGSSPQAIRYDSMRWSVSNSAAFSPNNFPVIKYGTVGSPPKVAIDSVNIRNNRQVAWYSIPGYYSISTPGIYTVTITVYRTTTEGCGNEQDYEFQLEASNPPIADFTWINNGCVTDSVRFSDNTITAKPTYLWFWDFGEPSSGANNTSRLKNPSHKYASPGTYTVTYYNITTPGCIGNTAIKNITVTNVPIANFGISSPVCQGLPVTFSDTSIAFPPGTVLSKWYWDFGDGFTTIRTNGSDTTHIYNSWNSTISATLRVETSSGCKSPEFFRTFRVNPIPFVDFTMPAGVCLPGDSAHFFDASTIADGSQAGFGYAWNFGDPASGANNISALKNPAHYYNGITPPPPYPVKLTVTSAAGCVKDTTKNLVNVFPQAHGLFTAPSPVCLGNPLIFTSSSDPLAGNSIAAYNWDFGDATTGTGNPINHTYLTAGVFTVKHWIQTDKGCYSDTAVHTVTIYPIPAITGIVSSNPITCLGNEGFITLNGLQPGQIYTVNYDKNGVPQPALTLTASAGGSVTITGLTAGTYSNINCTANNCTSANTATQILTDPPLPASPLPGSNAPICSGTNLNLTASAITGASSYNWTGPNSFSSSLQNPVIANATIAASGAYFVTVTVNNCTSLLSAALNVVVNEMPVITNAVSTNPTTCGGTNGFITLSGLTPGKVYTINYKKNGVAQAALVLTASASGQLVIPNLSSATYSNINCSASNCTSADAPTQVLSDPSAPAPPTTSSNSPVCSGTTLNLNASNIANASYAWSGPNGFNSTLQNPVIGAATTAASGVYLVSVTVNNCVSASSLPLSVIVNPTPAISGAIPANPTTCLGNEGFITLNGLLPGQVYTVNYYKNAVAQPTLTLTAGASGSIVIPLLTAGTYSSINCTANNCTSANAAVQILVDPPLPVAPVPGGNSPICAGSTLNLTATTLAGASGYSWTGPNGFTSNLQNPSILNATTAASGNYFVTVTKNNCTSLPSVALNVLVNVMPAISNVTTINPTTCAGSDGSITLFGLIPGQAYTVNYKKNALAQAPLNLIAGAAGTLLIPNLTAGTYSNINCTANNCTSADAATQLLSDPNAPAAPAAGSNSPLCSGLNLSFTAAPVANGNFNWTGPNGFTSTLANPGITGVTTAATGNYSVTVTVSNCVSAAAIVPVVIYPLPTGNFTFTLPGCQTRTINFTDASVSNAASISSWAWNFGDPATGANNVSVTQNPSHEFANPGTYTVTLTVTNSNGCVSALLSKQVVISERPAAGYIIPEVCLSDTYAQFTDTSHLAGSGAITQWSWNFGDANATIGNPNTSSVQNPQHSYTAVGNYTVQLIVTSNIGCKDTISHVLTVNGSFPLASFTVTNPATLCANDSVSIVNTSTVFPGVITKVEIYWDNVNFPGIFEKDDFPFPNKVYRHKYLNFQNPLTKTFTIRFRAYSGGVCVNDKISVITVNAAPKVQFTAIPNACLDAAPYLITQATETGGVPGTFVFSGPGISTNGIFNPASVGPGTYTIKYTFTSTAGGCVDTASKQITVLDPPLANFSYSNLNCAALPITFTDASSTPVGTLTSWIWDFGDGTPVVTKNSAAPFTHAFSFSGNYNVTLKVVTSNGCISVVKTLPLVIKPIPRAGFSFPASVCLPNAVILFTNTSAISDGSALTYSWDFGDPGSGSNNTSVAVSPTHTYLALGPYSVKLQVTSIAGCVHDTTIAINIIHPQPKADFTFNKPSVCIQDNVIVTDASDGKDGIVNQWNWAMGDGSVRNIPSFPYTYSTDGTFNVSLFIKNSKGCNSDTITKPFTVHPFPVVDAGPDRAVLEGGSIIITPNVTGNDLTYLWTPSLYLDNSTFATPTASNLLDDITYTLLVTARGGCSKSDQVFVKLLRAPKIPNTFTPNNDGINDVWSIEYLNTYPNNRVQVFTRTGQLVFESHGYATPWNGTKNGKSLPFDTYYYIIEPNNGRKPMTGFVTIVK